MMRVIDINLDAAETDAPLESWLASASSLNLACGFHAGDSLIMENTVQFALAHGLAIGAHPGLPDRAGFGRCEMARTDAEIYADTLYQVGALHAIVRAAGGTLQHVKPHGALYHMACRQPHVAAAIACAVAALDLQLAVVGPRASLLLIEAQKKGLPTWSEAFADRTYGDDGQLLPRAHPAAVIMDPVQAAAQALRLAQAGQAQTLCVHGDQANARAVLIAVRQTLEAHGFTIAPPRATPSH
jgi:UPF0271 protein